MSAVRTREETEARLRAKIEALAEALADALVERATLRAACQGVIDSAGSIGDAEEICKAAIRAVDG